MFTFIWLESLHLLTGNLWKLMLSSIASYRHVDHCAPYLAVNTVDPFIITVESFSNDYRGNCHLNAGTQLSSRPIIAPLEVGVVPSSLSHFISFHPVHAAHSLIGRSLCLHMRAETTIGTPLRWNFTGIDVHACANVYIININANLLKFIHISNGALCVQ